MEANIISKDETVQAVIRRHWMNILPVSATFAVVGLISLYGFYLLGRYSDSVSRVGSLQLAIIGLIAVVALNVLLGYSSWWVYRQNRLIVTDKNLYQLTQNSLFSRAVSQFELSRLQDVSAKQNGFIASMFDYGDVTAETAGEEDAFVFRTAPRPQQLAAYIMECHKKCVAGALPPDL